jgi:CpeS-like protein
MDIEEFFQLSAGKWYSHRTGNDFTANKSESGQSEIIIETLTSEHPEVIKLCEQHKVNPSLASVIAKINWNDTTKLNQKNTGSAVLVLVADKENPEVGKLLRQSSNTDQIPSLGHYRVGSDEALTLIAQSETISAEERIWFASPNLRMRVNVMKHLNGFSSATFTTEIRMGVAPAKVDSGV